MSRCGVAGNSLSRVIWSRVAQADPTDEPNSWATMQPRQKDVDQRTVAFTAHPDACLYLKYLK
jgi:hypothetical protein